MPDSRSRTRLPQRQPPRSASRRKRERRRTLARTHSQTGRRLGRRGILGAGVAAVAVGVLLIVLLTRGGGSTPQPPTQASPTPVPTPTAQPLALLASAATGSPVDGMQCATSEAITNRAAAHLAIFVDGTARQVPAGVGIASPAPPISTDAGPFVPSGTCYYPLLTHTSDGIILVEPPTPTTLTLGNFFDIWGQALNAGQLGPASGTVTVYLNGSKYTGDLRAIPITRHALIQLDVGVDTPPAQFMFPPGD